MCWNIAKIFSPNICDECHFLLVVGMHVYLIIATKSIKKTIYLMADYDI